MNCSYCGVPMAPKVFSVKRPVPNGAKDLGISDDTVMWNCARCSNKSNERIQRCHSCGSSGPSVDIACSRSAIKIGVLVTPYQHFPGFPLTVLEGYDPAFYRCINCISCDICKEPIGDGPFLEHPSIAGVTYAHRKCAENWRPPPIEIKMTFFEILEMIFRSCFGAGIGFIVGLILAALLGTQLFVPLAMAVCAIIWGRIYWSEVVGKRKG